MFVAGRRLVACGQAHAEHCPQLGSFFAEQFFLLFLNGLFGAGGNLQNAWCDEPVLHKRALSGVFYEPCRFELAQVFGDDGLVYAEFISERADAPWFIRELFEHDKPERIGECFENFSPTFISAFELFHTINVAMLKNFCQDIDHR